MTARAALLQESIAHWRQARKRVSGDTAKKYEARIKELGRELKTEMKKKNPAKAVRLRNFTGTIKKNANGTVSISGRAKKRNPSKRSVRKRVGVALRKYVRGKR